MGSSFAGRAARAARSMTTGEDAAPGPAKKRARGRGELIAYQVPTTVGSLEYVFGELAAPGEIRPSHSELVYKGNGAAMVTVPDAHGRPVGYRLVMQGGTWKITEIRGGRVRR